MQAGYSAHSDQLAALKATYDPTNLFHGALTELARTLQQPQQPFHPHDP